MVFVTRCCARSSAEAAEKKQLEPIFIARDSFWRIADAPIVSMQKN
jgi:hypothetical protein